MNVIATNIGGGTLPADGRIEISFDRLLLPASITRQTFIFQQSGGAPQAPPIIGYDPVARVVTITPTALLTPSQPYSVTIASPSSPSDPNGLRAIDSAELAPGSATTYSFVAGPAAGSTNAPPPATTYVDFCASIRPIFGICGGCHSTPRELITDASAPLTSTFYGGLVLDTPVAVALTALGRVAHGANTGPLAGGGQPAGRIFNEDMPIIDPGPGPIGSAVDAGSPSTSGDPGHSWLMYKVLMAEPTGQASSDAGAAPTYTVTCAGGAPCPQPLPDDERARLAGAVIGREMPYSASATGPGPGLGLADLETLQTWIAGGAPLPPNLSCQ